MTEEKPDAHVTDFIRNIIDSELASGKFASRRWAGQPALAAAHAAGKPDSAAIRTRFPPEPNGYLHIGHAKSICLNFGLAAQYGGRCHLRFDDTNPEKEEQEYVDSIIDSVRWLGFSWDAGGESNLYFASDYFEWMYQVAEKLIEGGFAYVDSLTAEQMRDYRGTLTEPGRDSPYRNRSVAENLAMFRDMRAGKYADGAHVLRARIDMSSPNINLRDPAIYRIKRGHHHRTADAWCIYPMYTFAHPLEDAFERITHSICTLEFEDQRPFYDWLLERARDAGFFADPLPQQIEFSRLNVTYIITSKRYLSQLVSEGHVEGWDDPRMPTIAGARRRGYPPQAFHLFAERTGVSKSPGWIEYGLLEDCVRECLNASAERRIAVLDPLKLLLAEYPDDAFETCLAPNHPQKPELGKRELPFSRELWIEREDFQEVPAKGYFRLFPGNKVRLRYAYVIECTGCEKDASGRVTAVHARVLRETRSGTAGADSVKVKGNIHWLCARAANPATVRLYDRLFKSPHPGRETGNLIDDLHAESIRVVTAYVEPGLMKVLPEMRFQFERHGYFVVDRVDSRSGTPVFNRAVTLRDSWGPSK
ncbi:MAG TPA: glutamine--tRNA ligase/YqeY domain fusion protein [Usitatibacteraceae bacterium]|nr:glutamine--tRNA ligase/YqeY domain fusion protein [Usitatibacteraceae bacterium]